MKKYKRIGIIGAMAEEIAEIKRMIQKNGNCMIQKRAGMEFITGQLLGKEVVAVQSGVGKVNAGICTQILADIYDVDLVINTGVAGALHKEVAVHDMIISKDLVQHDVDASGFGYALGEIPGVKTVAFPVDEEIRQLAFSLCRKVNPDIQVFIGRILSGDQFIQSSEVKSRLVREFDGYCAEMEGAAIAQAAYLNGISCLVLRAISDQADEKAPETFDVVVSKAIEHCIRLTLALIRELT